MLSELIVTELVPRPLNFLISYPFSKFHILMVSSLLPETIYLLSGLMATAYTKSLWPVNVFISYPVSKFHILMFLSQLPETMNLLSELITIVTT